jgi:hypothetical protein
MQERNAEFSSAWFARSESLRPVGMTHHVGGLLDSGYQVEH